LSKMGFALLFLAVLIVGIVVGLVSADHFQNGTPAVTFTRTVTHEEQVTYVVAVTYSTTCLISAEQSVTNTAQTSVGPTGAPYVLVTYSELAPTTRFGVYNNQSQPGYVYQEILVTVQNNGYDSVSVSSGDFYLMVGTQRFQVSPVTFYFERPLKDVALHNGGTDSGFLVYEIPANSTAPQLFWNETNDLTVRYQQK